MSMSKVQNRDARLKALAVADSGVNEGMTLDTILSSVTHDEENKGMVVLDGIMAQDEKGSDLSDILLAGITHAKSQGVNVGMDAIDLSIAAVGMIADSALVTMDGINTIDGSGVVATAVAFNQYVILNSNINGLDGNIGDMEAIKDGSKDNIKFKVFSFNPEITDGMGDIGDNTVLTPQNVSLPMAFATRDLEMVGTRGVISYVFDIKAKSTDAGNYPIGRGETELVIGSTGIRLNDYEVSTQEKKPKRTITMPNDKQVTLTVDYALGKVTVDLEDNVYYSRGY